MYPDSTLARAWLSRTAQDDGTGLLLSAWARESPNIRAALLAARGDLRRAAACAGGGWKKLLDGDTLGALREVGDTKDPSLALLEAEGLFAGGAIVAAFEILKGLVEHGDAAGCLAMARRLHLLGDHPNAMQVAQRLPLNVHVALVGARSALSVGDSRAAANFINPMLTGAAPISEPLIAGAVAVVTSLILARSREYPRLQDFVQRMLFSGDLAEEMIPGVARAAWLAGMSKEVWKRFGDEDNPWMAAGRLELAILSGDAGLAESQLKKADVIGAPSMPLVKLLKGEACSTKEQVDEAQKIFKDGNTVHLWKTHPQRWKPWIDAALASVADVQICDFGAGQIPDRKAIPNVIMDDSGLAEILRPISPKPKQSRGKQGLWIDALQCHGWGAGYDWPEEETAGAMQSVSPEQRAVSKAGAAVVACDIDAALVRAQAGLPTIAIVEPGEAFWAGPLSEAAWPNMKMVRMDPIKNWSGAGERIADLAKALLAVPQSSRKS